MARVAPQAPNESPSKLSLSEETQDIDEDEENADPHITSSKSQLLWDKITKGKRKERKRYSVGRFVPAPELVASKLKYYQESRHDEFGPPKAPNKEGGGNWGAFNKQNMKIQRLIKLLVMSEMVGTTWKQKLRRTFNSYWYRTDLLKIVQATQYVYDTSMRETFSTMLEECHNGNARTVEQIDDIVSESTGCVDTDAVSCKIIVALCHLACLMGLVGLRAGCAKAEREGCGQHLPTPPSDEVLRTPNAEIGFASFRPTGVAATNCAFDPGWFSTDAPMIVFTLKYMDEAGVRSSNDYSKGGHHRTLCRAQYAFREMLSEMLAQLRTDLDTGSMISGKVLGTVVTIAFTVISWLMQRAQKAYDDM